eukprot:5990399-Amphidinium_carterae.1
MISKPEDSPPSLKECCTIIPIALLSQPCVSLSMQLLRRTSGIVPMSRTCTLSKGGDVIDWTDLNSYDICNEVQQQMARYQPNA